MIEYLSGFRFLHNTEASNPSGFLSRGLGSHSRHLYKPLFTGVPHTMQKLVWYWSLNKQRLHANLVGFLCKPGAQGLNRFPQVQQKGRSSIASSFRELY
jgi:hypothetical protein